MDRTKPMSEVSAEADLRSLREVLDLLPDRVARYRRDDLRILYVNQAQADTAATTREDMIGRSVADYLTAAQLAELEHDLSVLDADAPVGRHLVFRGGRWTEWIERLVPGPDGDEILAIGRDLTDQRVARARLQELETRFEQVMLAAPIGMMVVDLEGRIRQVNPAVCELLDRDHDALIGRSVFSITHEDHRTDDVAYALRVRSGEIGAETPLTTRYLRGDGEPVWCEARLSLLHDERGHPREVVAQIIDITAQLERECFLEQQAAMEREVSARLRELDELKDTFLAAVSHELRTPLTVLVGVAELLQAHVQRLDAGKVELLLGRQVHQAQRLERLLSDLLDLGRLTGGDALGVRSQRVDLARVVLQVVDGGDLPSCRLVFDLEPVEVDVEVAKIERVVTNLLVNALRHTPPGSEVWVRLRPSDGGALLLVEDCGPGVPPELRERIFAPFEQGDTEAARVGGTGIGLSVVRRFVLMHGGRVWVEDRAGGGASFRVWLPAAAD